MAVIVWHYSLVWLLPPVFPLVVLQVDGSLQHFAAVAALELRVLMHHHVHLELGHISDALATGFALQVHSKHFLNGPISLRFVPIQYTSL